MSSAAQLKLDRGTETELPPVSGARPSVAVSTARRTDAVQASPARLIQERLAEDYRVLDEEDDGRRWRPGATLALGGGISLVLWAVIGLALAAIR